VAQKKDGVPSPFIEPTRTVPHISMSNDVETLVLKLIWRGLQVLLDHANDRVQR
jgi:hypothetical protein